MNLFHINTGLVFQWVKRYNVNNTGSRVFFIPNDKHLSPIIKFGVYVLICMLLPFTVASQTDNYAEKIHKKIEQKRYQDADILVEKWLQEEPSNDSAIIIKTRLINKRAGRKEANEYIIEQCLNKPSFILATVCGDWLENSGRFEDAEKYFSMADSLAENKFQRNGNNLSRAVNLHYLKKVDSAIVLLNQIIADSASCANCYSGLFYIYFEQEKFEEALASISKAIQLDSMESTFNSNMGLVLSSLKRYEEAMPYLNRSLEQDATTAYGFSNRAYCELQLNRLTDAIKDINHSITLDPKNSYAYRNRALIYLAQHLKHEACTDLNAAKELGFDIFYGKEVNELIEQHCK